MPKLFATDTSFPIKYYKRILDEIEDVNRDFMTLRTKIFPDPDDQMNLFYFVMFPNDGVMAHMPIIGRLYFPPTYPADPPVLHKFTKTGRFNPDAYDGYINRPEQMHSSMCFDLLRPRSDYTSTWKPDYTLSALFATLMQALVSMYVEQDHGGNYTEFVTMEKLAQMKQNAQQAVLAWSHIFKPETFPEIPTFEALPVPNCQPLDFGTDVIVSNTSQAPLIVSSQPLDMFKHTIGIDLSELKPNYVFSIVLANSRTDMTGKKSGTILVRNGVTASAAKKLKNQPIKWFYHGKPMNEGNLKLFITIAKQQFTICYLDENNKMIVHGDCPISYLTNRELGDLDQAGEFYLNIFLKKKSGGGQIKLPIISGPNGPTTGFIHNPDYANTPLPPKMSVDELADMFGKKLVTEEMVDDQPSAQVQLPPPKKPPVYVSLDVSPTDTQMLRDKLAKRWLPDLGLRAHQYPVQRTKDSPTHLTLAFYKEIKKDWPKFCQEHYQAKREQQIPIVITGVAVDGGCVALTVRTPEDLKIVPDHKECHLTMMLNKKPPVYSNELITRLKKTGVREGKGERLYEFPEPIVIQTILKYH